MAERDATNWTSPTGSNDRVTFVRGQLDEIVGTGTAHLERLASGRWFLSIGHDDGSETAIWFESESLRRPFIERRHPAEPDSPEHNARRAALREKK